MSSLLDKVQRFVDRNWDGTYITRFDHEESDGTRFYLTTLHGPSGPAVWTAVFPWKREEHTMRVNPDNPNNDADKPLALVDTPVYDESGVYLGHVKNEVNRADQALEDAPVTADGSLEDRTRRD